MQRRVWIALTVLALLAAAGGAGYWAYTQKAIQPRPALAQTLQTGTVSRGDIVLTADGTGNLLPADEAAVAFQVSGVLAEVKVKVGDRVRAGDVLAKLDTLELYNTVREATYELEQARFNLQKAQREAAEGTSAAIARKGVEAARLALANAQGSYASTLLKSDVSADVREAKAWADFWQSELGDAWLKLDARPDSEKALLAYERAGAEAERATNKWKQLEQDAKNQLLSAQRNIIAAQQSYLSALSAYSDTLSGDPVRENEFTVVKAEIKLTQAQMNLMNATLTAPINGTVTEVTASVGENVGSSPIVTLIDMENPQVRFWVEESDLNRVAVGNRVNIVLEAWPDDTFTGTITRVDPELVTVGNTTAVQAWASVDPPAKPTTFLSGMTAEVEVIAAETRNALLVPVQALRQLAPGQYAVFVVQADGKLELRWVQVGLQDFVNAEILSGLAPGEVVSLGTQAGATQTTRTTRTTQSQNMGGPPDGMPFPGGMP